MYASTIIPVIYILEYTLRSHLSTFDLDASSEVLVADTGHMKDAIGARRTPLIHPLGPGKPARTLVNRVSR